MRKCCFKKGVNMLTKMLTKEQINLIISYVSTKANEENHSIIETGEDVFSIDDRINQQLAGYKQSNVEYVAIGDRGIIPLNEEDSFGQNREFRDMMNICSSYARPKIKVKALARENH